ncbi:MAG: hypothetical protein HY013_11790 [Candidatus Solibacter usitatus]|nr:hypothetical protein [Candidatus Solibacter usitatus]
MPITPTYLESLHRAMAAAGIERRIGTPVALRAYFQLTADHGLLLGVLAEAAPLAGRGFSSPPLRVYAQGAERDGYLTALVEFAGGQTAVLTAEACRTEEPQLLILLIGNQGALQYQDTPGRVALGAGDPVWRAAIRESLESGRPAMVKHAA